MDPGVVDGGVLVHQGLPEARGRREALRQTDRDQADAGRGVERLAVVGGRAALELARHVEVDVGGGLHHELDQPLHRPAGSPGRQVRLEPDPPEGLQLGQVPVEVGELPPDDLGADHQPYRRRRCSASARRIHPVSR